MRKIYNTEREGQIEFFENYGIPWMDSGEVLADNTDGVWNGILLEFKLSVNDINRTLFQAVKYLSKMRVKGESVPAEILLISLNTKTAYLYDSKDYFDDIHKVYIGAASKDNDGFAAKKAKEIVDYDSMAGSLRLKEILKKKKVQEDLYMPVAMDENCIVGWAERYYREIPSATKGDFIGDDGNNGGAKVIGEIRGPKHFKGMILPYTGKTNERFKNLMDKLNDRMKKKKLGAFYTPIPYAELAAAELVKKAVDNVPEGNDYIILDRCAGSGSLGQAIINTLGDEVASHIICSTYEYYEYKVLLERVGDKVRAVLPPTEADVVYSGGYVLNADAMSEEYLKNEILQKYIQDDKCTIILFENPPYHDESSGVEAGKAVRTGKDKSFIGEEMKKEVPGVSTNDIVNRFIWSAFKYYLRNEYDAYIVFSPIKYWKQYGYVDATPAKGFCFNREHFHASPSAVSCILWQNKRGFTGDSITLETYDINKDGKLDKLNDVTVKRVKNPASRLYSKVTFDKNAKEGMWCEKSGYPTSDRKSRVKGYVSDEVVGYMEADSFQIVPLKRNITRFALYDGNGCYLTKDNYLNLLPLWAAKHIPLEQWHEKDVYATTSDGGCEYTKDSEFLKECLIFSCLSNQNKCLSIVGPDGKLYRNEICFDNTHTPIAVKDLSTYELNPDEAEILKIWSKIMDEAKKTKLYDKRMSYGVYQISRELNTYKETGTGKAKKKIYDYPELNGDLNTLRVKLKQYYNKYIRPKMFQYELVK